MRNFAITNRKQSSLGEETILHLCIEGFPSAQISSIDLEQDECGAICNLHIDPETDIHRFIEEAYDS